MTAFDKEKAISILSNLATPPWRPMPSRKLASILGVSLQTLANWRVRETGPHPERAKKGKGNKTFYCPDVVLSWLSGGSIEPWEFSRDWLAKRDIMVIGVASKESTEWLIDAVNAAYR